MKKSYSWLERRGMNEEGCSVVKMTEKISWNEKKTERQIWERQLMKNGICERE